MVGAEIGLLLRAADHVLSNKIEIPVVPWGVVQTAGKMSGPLVLFSFGLQVNLSDLCKHENCLNVVCALLGRYVPGIVLGAITLNTFRLAKNFSVGMKSDLPSVL